MADLALGSLTAATSIGASDILYTVIGGNSRKITVANFLTSPTLTTPVLGVATATSLALSASGKLSFNSGTNQRAGNATLVGGTITVSNTTVTANTVVMLTRKTSGGTIGTAITYTLSAGVSFTITSDNILDTSTFSYLLIEVP